MRTKYKTADIGLMFMSLLKSVLYPLLKYGIKFQLLLLNNNQSHLIGQFLFSLR